MSRRLDGRVALVTGASRGLGAAVAEAFAAEGARVILLARTVKGLEAVDDRIAAKGGAATLMPFDLNQTDKIEAVGDAIAQRFGRLDILVGNAAILGALSPVAHVDARVWESVFRVNATANALLIRALDPLLRQAPAGRAIFTTSAVAGMRAPFWGPYAASKAALEAIAGSYAQEVAYSRVRVHVVDPGIMRTDLRAEAFPGENPQDLLSPDVVAARFVDLAADEGQEAAA